MNILSQTWFLVIGISTCTFFMTYLWADKIIAWLEKRSLGSRAYVLERLELMFVETEQKKITILMLLLSFGLGAIFFLLFWPNLILGTIMAASITILGWQIPKWAVDYLYKRRCSKFVDQMVDALTIMANGVRSGLSLPQSLERVVNNMANPIQQEFNLVLSQVRLGLSIEEALNALATRIPQADVQMFVTAINILKETGGNLGETFSTIVETIRERQKIEKKIEALTAQGMMQGIIITSVPFVLMLVFFVVDPTFIKPLFSTTLGVIFILIMLVLQIIGGLWIRKIVNIRV